MALGLRLAALRRRHCFMPGTRSLFKKDRLDGTRIDGNGVIARLRMNGRKSWDGRLSRVAGALCRERAMRLRVVDRGRTFLVIITYTGCLRLGFGCRAPVPEARRGVDRGLPFRLERIHASLTCQGYLRGLGCWAHFPALLRAVEGKIK